MWMNLDNSTQTSWWVNFLCAEHVQHRMSITDKRASVQAAASRGPGPQWQLFTHTFLQLNYIFFLATTPHTSMRLQMHRQKHTTVLHREHKHDAQIVLLESWQRLPSSEDTEGACCLFASSSALFPLERYVTTGRREGEKKEQYLPAVDAPRFHFTSIHPSNSPSSSNRAAVFS